MPIGYRFKEIRQRLGVTQTEFAKMLGVSKQTLYKYENNIITNIPSNIVEAAAQLGHVSPSYLMGWESDAEYYTNPDTVAIAQKMKESKEMTMLFDAASDADPEDIKVVYDMLLALKRKERHDG